LEHLKIVGGRPLVGSVGVSGAKNAAVAIIPAALLSRGVCVIDNLPDIEDAVSLVDALEKMGARCERTGSGALMIDASGLSEYRANFDSVRRIRASYYLIGALLGRFRQAEVALPGGCNFGSRPIDQHIKGFEALGATVGIEHGMVIARADRLRGAHIYLDMASVGATINIMMAAVLAEGRTVIENAAKEPHIVDTANFLNILGADVKGAGTDTIRVSGVERLGGGEYTIIPDQIEAGTYMIAAAITGGDITVGNVIPKHMESVTAKLRETGAFVHEGDDTLIVRGARPIHAASVKTMYYPGFPTDLQPQMVALLTLGQGASYVTETVFENRYQYVNEMKRLGCDITVDGRMAVVNGVPRLTGAHVTATDLRAGAALVVAALAAEGETFISNVKYIDRGYENMVGKLRALGADISRAATADE
jgi:UDP-N-acetylglucosamine 1-carboxyvinyltransferase